MNRTNAFDAVIAWSTGLVVSLTVGYAWFVILAAQ